MARILQGAAPEDHYTLIPNELARSADIPARAKAVYIFLKSHRDGWHITTERVGKSLGLSKNTVSKALQDLELSGWVRRIQNRTDAGEFAGWDYEVLSYPAQPGEEAADPDLPDTKNAVSQKVGHGEPHTKNAVSQKTRIPKIGIHKKTNNQEDQKLRSSASSQLTGGSGQAEVTIMASTGTAGSGPAPIEPGALSSDSQPVPGASAPGPQQPRFGFQPPAEPADTPDSTPQAPTAATEPAGGPTGADTAAQGDSGPQGRVFPQPLVDQVVRLLDAWDRGGRLTAQDRRELGVICAEALQDGVPVARIERALRRLDDGKTRSWRRLVSLIEFEAEGDQPAAVRDGAQDSLAAQRRRQEVAQHRARVASERADGRGADSAAKAAGYSGGVQEMLQRLREGKRL